MDLSDAIK